MMEVWRTEPTILLIILGAIVMGFVIGIWWGSHSVKAPFRERRLERRTILQRLKWNFNRKVKPIFSQA